MSSSVEFLSVLSTISGNDLLDPRTKCFIAMSSSVEFLSVLSTITGNDLLDPRTKCFIAISSSAESLSVLSSITGNDLLDPAQNVSLLFLLQPSLCQCYHPSQAMTCWTPHKMFHCYFFFSRVFVSVIIHHRQ